MIIAFFLTHWFQFNYAPLGQPWYQGADWPNVFVLLPLAILGTAGFFYHLAVTKRLHARIDDLATKHDQHAEKLKLVLDALDPETDGGLADVLDRLDPGTPGGLAVIAHKLDDLVHISE